MSGVGVVSLLPFCEREGRFYLPGFDRRSHACWTDHFAETVLLKPELVADEVPPGWEPMTGRITPRPLYQLRPDFQPGFLERRRRSLAVLREAIPGLGLLYLRMPAFACSWAFSAARGSGTPLAVELHGDWAGAFLAEWRGSPVRRLARRAVAAWADRRTRQMARAADLLCCIGPALRDAYGRGREAYVTTAHAVPEADFLRREDTCAGDEIRILYVGELVPRKGVAHLIDAVAALPMPARLEIVGDGPLRAELEARAARAGLGPRTRFHGNVAQGPALLAHFRGADVLALPSVAGEGLPRVLQEAMAASCPVVATDVGSVRHQLGSGRFGAVVPPGDAGALAAAIEKLVVDGAQRRAVIAAAYAEALRHSFERQRAEIGEILVAHFDASLFRDPPG